MKKLVKLVSVISMIALPIQWVASQTNPKVDTPKDEIFYQCAPCGCPHDGQHFETMGACPSCNMPLLPAYQGIELERRPPRPRVKVGILLFNGADIMDVTGPWSVFEHAGMEVVTMAKTTEMVQVGMTMNVKPDFSLQSLPEVDVIVVPGGGPAESGDDEEIVQWLKNRYNSTKTMFSVCSGAFFLGEAGILDGHEATTFASLIPTLEEQFPAAQVLNSVQYTDSGKVVTSAGLSSGIEAAFHVVSKYYGLGRAKDIANHMEYDWQPENDYARSQLADNFILNIRSLVRLFSTEYIYSHGDSNGWEYRFVLSNQITPQKVTILLEKELDKNKSWKKNGKSSNSLHGILEHDTLGKARVEINFDEQGEGVIASIMAEKI